MEFRAADVDPIIPLSLYVPNKDGEAKPGNHAAKVNERKMYCSTSGVYIGPAIEVETATIRGREWNISLSSCCPRLSCERLGSALTVDYVLLAHSTRAAQLINL